MANRRACTTCNAVTDNKETQQCPKCGAGGLSDDWSGLVVIAHPEKSQIADEMGVTEPGEYALKVR